MKDRKNIGTLFLLMLSGIVLGGFLGQYVAKYPSWEWLNYGLNFGLDEPLSIEMQIMRLTFGLRFKITIAGVVGMAFGAFVYKKI
ncbi:MAG: DUF4321 domain-containing protein [Clostridiales bacterium]|jgi:uncharacterized membrane protein YedE/YeeE|nr:DUF4321 domain-containing protein [Clostridiales bacterium]